MIGALSELVVYFMVLRSLTKVNISLKNKTECVIRKKNVFSIIFFSPFRFSFKTQLFISIAIGNLFLAFEIPKPFISFIFFYFCFFPVHLLFLDYLNVRSINGTNIDCNSVRTHRITANSYDSPYKTTNTHNFSSVGHVFRVQTLCYQTID